MAEVDLRTFFKNGTAHERACSKNDSLSKDELHATQRGSAASKIRCDATLKRVNSSAAAPAGGTALTGGDKVGGKSSGHSVNKGS
jgi:hypothetical protein